jgi:hypothetical protein
MSKKIIRGVIAPGISHAGGWESELMSLVRGRTGFSQLRPGTLNVLVKDPRPEIQKDFEIKIAENPIPTLREGYVFERCRLARNGKVTRALLVRTTTDYWGLQSDHRVLEFMAERNLLDFFRLNYADEIEVEFYEGPRRVKEAAAETGGSS